jgi:hypothetical protein
LLFFYNNNQAKIRAYINTMTNQHGQPFGNTTITACDLASGFFIDSDYNPVSRLNTDVMPTSEAQDIKYNNWTLIATLTTTIDNSGSTPVYNLVATYQSTDTIYKNGLTPVPQDAPDIYVFVPVQFTNYLLFFSNSTAANSFVTYITDATKYTSSNGDAVLGEALATLSTFCVIGNNSTIPTNLPTSDSGALIQGFTTWPTSWNIYKLLKVNDKAAPTIIDTSASDAVGALLQQQQQYSSSPLSYASGSDLSTYTSAANGNVAFILIPATSVPCFYAGAIVETDQGQISIESIDAKTTTLNGKRILAITEDITADAKIVLLEKGLMSENVPDKNTYVTASHDILHNNKWTLAGYIVNKFVPHNGQPLYNILMGSQEVIKVNNMFVKTLPLEHDVAKKYIIQLFKSGNLANKGLN